MFRALRSSLNANRSSVGAVVCTQSPNGSVANQGKDNNGKQIRKYNPTEELLETSFGVRKRMAHDIQGNQNAREKSNDCNKRLQVEDQRSENLRRSREKSIEYNKPLDEAQQRCENYLEPQEKEERALRDHQSMKPLVRSNEVENGNNRSTHVNRHDSGNGIRAGHVRGYDVDNGNHGGNVRGHDVDKVNLGDHLRGRDVDNGNNGGHVKGHDVDDGSCGVQVRGQDVDDRNRGVHVRGHDDRNHGVHGVKNGNYNSRVINSVEQGRKRRPENYIKRVVEEEDWAARDQTRGSRARSQSLHDHHNDGNNGWNDIGTFEQCRKEGSENYISRNHDGNHGNDVIETKERWRRGIEISINRPEEEDRQRRPRR